jgi:hypothetical protein
VTTKHPWDFHPSLQEDHLIAACNLVVAAYNDALDYFLAEKGDNKWALGCRRYAWAQNNIRQAAESGKMPFLEVLKDQGNTFIFLIGAVPVKFKRTDPDEPHESIIRQSQCEAQQLSLAFPGLSDPGALRWRIVIEDDYEGEVLRVAFIGVDSNKVTQCFWEMPRDRMAPHITTVHEHLDEGVDLDPAHVDLLDDEADEEEKA